MAAAPPTVCWVFFRLAAFGEEKNERAR